MAFFKIGKSKIYYEYTSNRVEERDLVLCLNGLLSSVQSWNPIKKILEQAGFGVLTQDFRGQLKSGYLGGGVNYGMHIRDVLGLMDNLGIKNAHLMGTSYGGTVAQIMARAYPERVKSLVLIDSVASLQARERLFLDNRIKQNQGLDSEEKCREFLQLGSPFLFTSQYLKKLAKEVDGQKKNTTKPLTRGFFEGAGALYENFRKRFKLLRKKCFLGPVLLVHGQKDALFPQRCLDKLRDYYPQAEVILLPETGHASLSERPEVIASLGLGFLLKQRKY